MALSSPRHAPTAALPDLVLSSLAGFLALALGPLAALGPRGTPVWAILTLAVALAGLVRSNALGRMARSLPAILAVGGFLLLALVSCLWSPSPRSLATVAEIGYIAAGALAGGAWVSQLPGAEARRIAALFLAGMAAGIAIYGVEVLFDFPLYRWWNDAYAISLAEMMNTNVPKRGAALFCLLAWPAALAFDRLVRPGWALLPPAVFALVLLPLTSRSAIVGIAIGIVVFLAACRWATAVRRGLAGVVGIAFVAAIPIALFLDRVLNVTEWEWLFTSARHRVEIWGMAADRALTTPLLGQGIDSSRALVPMGEVSKFSPLNGSLLPLHPHNAALQIWLELGAAGAALALAAVLMLLAGTARLPQREQPFALALLASGLAMLSTAYGIWQAWWMAGFLAAGLMLRLAARIPADER